MPRRSSALHIPSLAALPLGLMSPPPQPQRSATSSPSSPTPGSGHGSPDPAPATSSWPAPLPRPYASHHLAPTPTASPPRPKRRIPFSTAGSSTISPFPKLLRARSLSPSLPSRHLKPLHWSSHHHSRISSIFLRRQIRLVFSAGPHLLTPSQACLYATRPTAIRSRVTRSQRTTCNEAARPADQ